MPACCSCNYCKLEIRDDATKHYGIYILNGDFQEDDANESSRMTCLVKSQKGDSNCNLSSSLSQNWLSENKLNSVNVDNRLCSFSDRTNVPETGRSHHGITEVHTDKEPRCAPCSGLGGTRAGISDMFSQNVNSRHAEHCSTSSDLSNAYQIKPTTAESTCTGTPTIDTARGPNAYGCTPRGNVTKRSERAAVKASIIADKNNISPPSENSKPRERKRSKRKFPGPAGVLPKLSPGQSLDNSMAATVQSPARVVHDDQDQTMASSSQSGDDMFNDGPWHRMLADIGPNGDSILRKFSIADILAKARRKQLPQMRAPLVFGVIESIDSQGHDTCVTITDKSGSMMGTFHRQLMKDYEEEIHLGTVMVLRQVGVISPSSRNHYLNITSTNIVLLYNAPSIDGSTGTQHHANGQDCSKLRDIVKEAEFQKQTLENDLCVRTRSGATTEIRCEGTPAVSSRKQPRCGSARLYSTPVVNNKMQHCPNTSVPEKCNAAYTSAGYGVDTMPRRSIHTSESMLSDHLPSSSVKSKWNFKPKSNVGTPKISSSTSGAGSSSKDDQFSIENQSQLTEGMTSTPAHIPPPPRLVMLGSNTDSRQQTRLNRNASTAQNAAADLCARVYQLKPTPACQPNNHKPAAFSVESLWQDDLSDDLLSQLSEEM